ncbi:unnamed protein product [Urochloa humidicola]
MEEWRALAETAPGTCTAVVLEISGAGGLLLTVDRAYRMLGTVAATLQTLPRSPPPPTCPPTARSRTRSLREPTASSPASTCSTPAPGTSAESFTYIPLKKFVVTCVPLQKFETPVYHRPKFILPPYHFGRK